jgi:hypothetical protein
MEISFCLRIGLAVVCAALALGCSGPSLTEVGGTVTLNEKPLDNVQVEFLPDPEQNTKGGRSIGITDAQGRFQLVGDDQRKGAVVGKHRVLITDLKQWEGISAGREDSNKPLKPSRVPARYTDVLATPFKNIEVKAGGSPIELKITSP